MDKVKKDGATVVITIPEHVMATMQEARNKHKLTIRHMATVAIMRLMEQLAKKGLAALEDEI